MNPLLEPSKNMHEAFPFDKLQVDHYLPAIKEAIERTKGRLKKIKEEPSEADFENTVEALEFSSEEVHRVSSVFFALLGAESNDELQDLAREISPRLAELSSDILLDTTLFERVQKVYKRRQALGLSAEQLKLVEKTHLDFVRNGALLGEKDKQRLRSLDRELSSFAPEFSDHVLKATNAFQLLLKDSAELDGLPVSAIEAAAQAAREAGHEGQWMITLHAPSFIPFLTYSARRDLRHKVWLAYNTRAYRDSFCNEALAKKIAKLRHERALLLGYSSHAHFVLEERMAETPERVMTFLQSLLEKSRPAALRDLGEVRELKKELSGDDELMPWDYAYYSEKLKLRKHKFDQEELRPYFRLDRVIDGAFDLATRLYGISFQKTNEVPVYHPDVSVYEVIEKDSKRFLGLLYADFFPRSSKRSGAWATSFRSQGFENKKRVRPHSSLVCNFTQPTGSKPSLLTLEEVETLFHEFGHTLHELLSECSYVTLSGTSVYWDFVELPSQIMENWVTESEFLQIFARHYETDESIPNELIEKIRATTRFQAGYSCLRQLNFAFLDMAWHSSDPSVITDVGKFERSATEKTRLFPSIEETNMSCGFSHIFAGGYSAGYYSYKWAEVLDADAFELFKEKGLFSQDVAHRFRENVLAQGGTQHPMDLYKNFRGREPKVDALLKRDGLL